MHKKLVSQEVPKKERVDTSIFCIGQVVGVVLYTK